MPDSFRPNRNQFRTLSTLASDEPDSFVSRQGRPASVPPPRRLSLEEDFAAPSRVLSPQPLHHSKVSLPDDMACCDDCGSGKGGCTGESLEGQGGHHLHRSKVSLPDEMACCNDCGPKTETLVKSTQSSNANLGKQELPDNLISENTVFDAPFFFRQEEKVLLPDDFENSIFSKYGKSKKAIESVDTGKLVRPAAFFEDRLPTISFYANAVGNIIQKGRCTTWLTGGPWSLLNGHCGTYKSANAEFGRFESAWGTKNYPPDRKIGKNRAYERLKQLGIEYTPSNRDIDKKIQTFKGTTERTFYAPNIRDVRTPTRYEYHNSRDISVVKFEPKQFDYLVNGKKEVIWLFPSHIFGYVPISSESVFSLGDLKNYYHNPSRNPLEVNGNRLIKGKKDLALIGNNYYTKSTSRWLQTYISAYGSFEGMEPNSFYDPPLPFQQDFNRWTFKHDGFYGVKGSSGSAVVDTRSNLAFAVYWGGNDTCTETDINCREVYSTPLPVEALRYSYLEKSGKIHPNFSRLRNKDVKTSYVNDSQSNWMAGKTKGRESFSCPSGHAIAGIVGSEISSNSRKPSKLGNLGVVCMPYPDPWDIKRRSVQFAKSDPRAHELYSAYTEGFANATVVAGGSIDIADLVGFPLYGIRPPFKTSYLDLNATSPNGVPLQYYITNYLTSEKNKAPYYKFLPQDSRQISKGETPQQQELHMCPPGFFLNSLSVEVDANNEVISVFRMTCRKWDDESVTHSRNLTLGSATSTSQSKVLSCPKSYVSDGIALSVSTRTEGVGLRCRKEPMPFKV